MGVVRLAICIGGVYAAFLLWAVAQERLSTPFPSTAGASSPKGGHPTSGSSEGDRFPSPLFLNYAQSLASCLSALTYLLFNGWRSGNLSRSGIWEVLGFDNLRDGWKAAPPRARRDSNSAPSPARLDGAGTSTAIPLSPPTGSLSRRSSAQVEKGRVSPMPNGAAQKERIGVDGKAVSEGLRMEKKGAADEQAARLRRSLPALLLQVSTFQTIAGPIGFLALRHISFPTMVLGKSCKLIPVMLLNVLLYRRRFSSHKYVVVALVTAGISIFMLLAPKKAGKGGGSDSAWGLSLLLFNLMVDGLTNSTQDQIFTLYPHYTGQQMMFHMSLLAQLILLPLMLLPLPSSPISLLPRLPILASYLPPPSLDAHLALAPPAAITSINFLITHPTALVPLLAYALLGGLGQLFIFETIQHFGSLTLTMVTVTRKLFTMLLSVLVFEHKLSLGQWVGVGVVFAGIGVEAGVKRREVMRSSRRARRS